MKASDSDARQPFTVVVGYEDYASGVRALELDKRLLARWSDSLDLRLVVWKFEPLGIPALLAKATEDAINADLIVISLSGNHPLPSEAAAWIARWRGKTLKQPALALLLDHGYQSHFYAREISTLVGKIAEDSGLQFFSSAQSGPSGKVAACEPVEEPEESTELLKTALHPDEYAEHWGLNE